MGLMGSMSDNNYYFDGAGSAGGPDTQGFTLCSRRINSFSARDCRVVFTSLAVISLGVAVAFAALGAWLILPFAGAEALALYGAYRWIVRHADDAEWLCISGNAVVLAVKENAQTRQYEFNCAWARLVVNRRHGNVRLALRSHGREVEVGRYLDSDARQKLARDLKARLKVQ